MSRRNLPNGSGDSVIGAGISVLFILFWLYTAFRGGAPIIFYIVGAFCLYTSLKGFAQRYTAYRQSLYNFLLALFVHSTYTSIELFFNERRFLQTSAHLIFPPYLAFLRFTMNLSVLAFLFLVF